MNDKPKLTLVKGGKEDEDIKPLEKEELLYPVSAKFNIELNFDISCESDIEYKEKVKKIKSIIDHQDFGDEMISYAAEIIMLNLNEPN